MSLVWTGYDSVVPLALASLRALSDRVCEVGAGEDVDVCGLRLFWVILSDVKDQLHWPGRRILVIESECGVHEHYRVFAVDPCHGLVGRVGVHYGHGKPHWAREVQKLGQWRRVFFPLSDNLLREFCFCFYGRCELDRKRYSARILESHVDLVWLEVKH